MELASLIALVLGLPAAIALVENIMRLRLKARHDADVARITAEHEEEVRQRAERARSIERRRAEHAGWAREYNALLPPAPPGEVAAVLRNWAGDVVRTIYEPPAEPYGLDADLAAIRKEQQCPENTSTK